MRAFCTVSAPLEVCAPPTRPLSPGSRFLALRLLGTTQPRTLYFLVEAKSRIREVYTQTCLHFAKQGMLDAELFGLAVLIDGEYMFADPESKLSKYGPKSWRSSHTHGLDANGRPLLELHFRVQFYVESPFMLRDETSKHNYYLQLRANTNSRDVSKDCSDQSMVLLGGLALQADFGDYTLDEDIGETSNGSSGVGGAIGGGGGSNSTSRSSNIINPSIEGGAGSSLTTSSTSLATSTSGTHPPVSASSSNASSNNNVLADYFQIEDYLPSCIRSAWCGNALRACHRENRGMSRADAELTYIRQVCALHDTINAHVYRMKLSKNESGPGSVYFIVYSKGIKILGENTQPITFLWPNIFKLSFERKKFEIRSSDNKITLYSSSDEKNKMILTLCRETHQFSMKVAARLKEAIKREEEESSSLHGCYMYSRSLNLPYKNKNDQRISVISSTSSNTTSGIVSDRVHSEDELEIIINSPPAVPIAAPSTESLALAHLLDRPSVSRQTSSVGQVSLKDLEDHFAALSVRSNTRSISSESTTDPSTERSRGSTEANETDSPNSQHNIGSQCSSTCSTVVVATDTITLSSLTAHQATTIRRPSTSSSLELGFSHTAQNSTLSEGASTFIDNEYQTNDGEDECVSGVYTLDHVPPTETSGVYTMNSSEMTGQSSEIAESESHESSHYGSFQPQSEMDDESVANIDSVDGQYRNCMENEEIGEFRLRSDSNVSGSGSFRGDGSDPTDNKHTLLSAEELTDLIVGRGTYPSRKTVSNTLDSDCDYVTLPLSLEGESYIQGHQDTAPSEDNDDMDGLLKDPPAPPKRIDSNIHHSLSSLVDIRTRSPPPYNARHQKTGLRGPPVVAEQIPPIAVPLREPPPYPQSPQQKPQPARICTLKAQHPKPLPKQKSPILPSPCSASMLPEEVTARFITTRPHINILKAHTSVISENPKPSFAAPTVTTISHPHSTSQSPLASIHGSVGVPLVPYNLHSPHKSMSAIPPPHPPYGEVKAPPPQTCVLLPVIKPRQYLPPPPPTIPRQPPPPPPPQLATVYTSQLARSQIELYQQQLYSDVDYVIYPLQDPAVSQQEYLDAKQGSILAAMAQSPPPPPYLAYHTGNPHTSTWDACKGHAIYRSTPYLPMALSTHSRYASTQNLSDTYVQLPGAYSPLYSPSVASLCSSYEPPPPPPLRPAHIAAAPTLFTRSRSDDNILNSVEMAPKIKRLPPPPPPYQARRVKKPPMPAPTEKPPPIPMKPNLQIPLQPRSTSLQRKIASTTAAKPLAAPTSTTLPSISNATVPSIVSRSQPKILSSAEPVTSNGASEPPPGPNGSVSSIDIQALREKSKHLDLPLISALCNDRSLLKQTKAFVMPKHPTKNSPSSIANNQQQSIGTLTTNTNKSKYPVSGLSTTQLSKPRKTSISHRHPNDKLPPLPVANTNNYVMDPTPPVASKHKSFSSQPSA